MNKNPDTNSLGKMLREYRKAERFTLRQVEEATNISNAYLSQLENGIIKTPSANILYKLANLYRGEFDYFLEVAGIIGKQEREKGPKSLEGHVLYSAKLDADEERELLKYLQFLRSKKRDEEERRTESN